MAGSLPVSSKVGDNTGSNLTLKTTSSGNQTDGAYVYKTTSVAKTAYDEERTVAAPILLGCCNFCTHSKKKIWLQTVSRGGHNFSRTADDDILVDKIAANCAWNTKTA
jgi:hypothetical protein